MRMEGKGESQLPLLCMSSWTVVLTLDSLLSWPRQAGILESEMQKMSPDMEAIEQFRQKDAEYNGRAAELEEATRTRDAVRSGSAGAMWGIRLDRAAELQEAARSKRPTLAFPQPMPQVRRAYEELRKKRLDEFMVAFNTISLKLKEMYQMITLGGDAELELVDSLDPFSEVRGRQVWGKTGLEGHLRGDLKENSCWRAELLTHCTPSQR